MWFGFVAAISPLENDGMLPRATLLWGRRRGQRKQLQSLQRTVKRKGFHIIVIIIITAFPLPFNRTANQTCITVPPVCAKAPR